MPLNTKSISSASDLDGVLSPVLPDVGLPVEAAQAVGTPVQVGAMSQALYLTEAGDTAAISMNDIHQGQMGDCFLVSPLGDLAKTHPDAIRNMIHQNADGSESVTLYVPKTGGTTPMV